MLGFVVLDGVWPCADVTWCSTSAMNEHFRRLSVMSWNVRGLGDSEKCDVVRDAIASATPSVCCLQETKLHDVDQFMASYLGGH